MRANRWGPWWALDKVQQCRVHIAHLLRQKHILIPAFSSLEKTATFPFIYSGAVCCRDAQQTTLKFLFRPEFSDLKLENTAKWKNESKLIFRYSGTGYKPPVFADIKMDLQKLIFNYFQCICSLIISRVLSQRRHCFLSLLIDVAGGARLML